MRKELNLSLEKKLFLAVSSMKLNRVSRRMIGDSSVHKEVVLLLHANGETGHRAVVDKTHSSKEEGTVLERNR